MLFRSCHHIHSNDETLQTPDYTSPDKIFYSRMPENKSISFYSRQEKMHFLLDELPKPVMKLFGDTIETTSDPVYKLCIQCHAPSVTHEVGTSDDKTPVGVHSGLSCNACHEPHSNNQRNSCKQCHLAISNCNIDVTTMNTTYFSSSSPNDIHFISCQSCHTDQ